MPIDCILLETVLTDPGPRSQVLEAGRRRFLPTSTIHAIKGLGGPATSLHLYSPLLRTMTHYSPDGGRIGSEVVTPVAPVLPSSALPDVLHPAGLGGVGVRDGDREDACAWTRPRPR